MSIWTTSGGLPGGNMTGGANAPGRVRRTRAPENQEVDAP